jgi:hypothetical protein
VPVVAQADFAGADGGPADGVVARGEVGEDRAENLAAFDGEQPGDVLAEEDLGLKRRDRGEHAGEPEVTFVG